jgi:hypothetical protein
MSTDSAKADRAELYLRSLAVDYRSQGYAITMAGPILQPEPFIPFNANRVLVQFNLQQTVSLPLYVGVMSDDGIFVPFALSAGNNLFTSTLHFGLPQQAWLILGGNSGDVITAYGLIRFKSGA